MKIHFYRNARKLIKTFILLEIILFSFCPLIGFSQLRDIFIPFQGVAKDYAGGLVNQRNIYIELALVTKEQPDAILFKELHCIKTDEWGLFSIQIGKGKWIEGAHNTLAQIDWSSSIHQLSINMAIEPEAPLGSWDYKQHLIALGNTSFGVVPYALYSFGNNNGGNNNDALFGLKLNLSDTATMLSNYQLKSSAVQKTILDEALNNKVAFSDSTNIFITPYQLGIVNAGFAKKLNIADSILGYVTPTRLNAKTFDTIYLSNRIDLKLNKSDTISISNRISTKLNLSDTIYMSDRIVLRELASNKSTNMNLLSDYSDQMYPSVKAAKDYIDNQVSNGAPDATINNRGILQLTGDLTGTSIDPRISTNAITTSKVADAAITDAKIASGIQASKVGLGNVTNNAQLYSLNGLTAQVQNLTIPGTSGLSPNWTSVGSTHTLNIPLANASAVTAGLISKIDYDHFNAGYSNSINSFTTNGNAGAASFSGQVLNIPQYTLSGLSGTVNPNYFLAGPSSGAAGSVQYRALDAADIPNNASNTSGNAATATALATPRTINSVAFDGTANITIKASTTNKLFFNTTGTGALATENFDGAAAKTISYNTIGAAPSSGSVNINTLGTISTGVWNGSVIGETVGGAGAVNGILKADGNGLVSAANSSDYQVPLTFSNPLINVSSNISISQVSSSTSGYLSSADWNTFNNKIGLSDKGVANGVASLNANGKIPTSQIPAISFSSGYVVNNQTQMLALSSAVVGSIAIRTDNSKNYVLSASDPTVLSNWLELLMPAAVSSVNGYTTGSIVLTSSDINEGTNLYFTDARVKSAVNGFLTVDAPLSYNTSNTKLSISQSGNSSSGFLSSTDWNTFNNKMNAIGVQSANTIYAAPNGINGSPSFRTLVAADIPTLNQNTTGNAASATILETTRSINGVGFNGSADITISANTSNAITFNNTGTGANSSASYNGSSAKTISYNTIGASPIAGTTSLTTLGTITTGTWNASVIGSSYGGAGTINGILKANGSGTVSEAIAGSDFEAPLSFTAPLSRTSNTINIQTATSSNTGALSATDWQLFNNKQATIVAGTGVSLSGGNTLSIGQSVATSSSPSFAGMNITGLNVSGIVANSAAGALSTIGTTGTGLVVKENTPTLITPNIGAATASSVNSTGDITAKRYKLTMPTATTAAATTNIDLSTGNVFTINLGANISTLTTSNAAVGTYLVKFVQDATGSRTVSFPAAWKWAGGVAPTLTTTATKLDIVTLVYDGSIFYATIVKNF
jgi:hypothetical protein